MGVTPVHLLQVRSVKSRAAPALGMMLCQPKPLRSSNPTGVAVGPRDNDAAALLQLVGVSCGLCLDTSCSFCLICAIFVLPAQLQLAVCRVLLCKEPVPKKEKQVCSLTEYPELEGSHEDHRVQPLSYFKTEKSMNPCIVYFVLLTDIHFVR